MGYRNDWAIIIAASGKSELVDVLNQIEDMAVNHPNAEICELWDEITIKAATRKQMKKPPTLITVAEIITLLQYNAA